MRDSPELCLYDSSLPIACPPCGTRKEHLAGCGLPAKTYLLRAGRYTDVLCFVLYHSTNVSEAGVGLWPIVSCEGECQFKPETTVVVMINVYSIN